MCECEAARGIRWHGGPTDQAVMRSRLAGGSCSTSTPWHSGVRRSRQEHEVQGTALVVEPVVAPAQGAAAAVGWRLVGASGWGMAAPRSAAAC